MTDRPRYACCCPLYEFRMVCPTCPEHGRYNVDGCPDHLNIRIDGRCWA